MEAAFLKHEGYFGTCGALMGNETEDGMTPKSHILAHSPKISGVPGPASAESDGLGNYSVPGPEGVSEKSDFIPPLEKAPHVGFCTFDLLLTLLVMFLRVFWQIIYHLDLLMESLLGEELTRNRPTKTRLSHLLLTLERLQELRHKSLAERELLETMKDMVLDSDQSKL